MYVPPCTDDQVRVDSPLCSVQIVHKCLLLSCAHLHDIPPYWSQVNGVEEPIRAGRERIRGWNKGTEEERKKVIKNLHRHCLSITINAAPIPSTDVFSYVFEAH